ncbi:hypothetical protein [Frankia tisae]|uniref:hypothetical protein n=1 Tax=Frankia tisae TaxID=2950104 RepID=UPI0021C0DA1F|nr:hypothetical protein [Frankia tisae]
MGDHVDGMLLRGFVYSDETDIAVLDGAGLARAPLPIADERVDRDSHLPPDLLRARDDATSNVPSDEQRGQRVRDVHAVFADTVSATLTRLDAPWRSVAPSLIRAIHYQGHLVWLVGGSVRDLVSGGTPADVRDLDLTGTMPSGEFAATAERVLRRAAVEHRPKICVSPRLVCSYRPFSLSDTARFFEYRGLAVTDLGVPATGGDFETDSAARDLTINSLYYDPVEHVVYDPTGLGLADLRSPRRLRTVNRTLDPRVAGEIVIRALKFGVRWPDAETAEVGAWLAGLPDDLFHGLGEECLIALRGSRDEYLGAVDAAGRRAVAARLGPRAVALLNVLDEIGDR